MDESSIGIDPERPDVVEALKSMNWEERLEEARARRKAALAAKSNPPQKRIRIVDASKVTPLRPVTRDAPGQASAAASVTEDTPVLTSPPVRPAVPATPVAEDVATGPDTAVAPEPVRSAAPLGRSLAGRTALGFGLGLGIGASVFLGFLALGFGEPGSFVQNATGVTAGVPVSVSSSPIVDVFPPLRPVPTPMDFASLASPPDLVTAPVRIAALGPLERPEQADGMPSGVFPDGTMSVSNEIAGFGSVRFVVSEAAPASPLRLGAVPQAAVRPARPSGSSPDAGPVRPDTGSPVITVVDLAALSLPTASAGAAAPSLGAERPLSLRSVPGAIPDVSVPQGSLVGGAALVPPAPPMSVGGGGDGPAVPGIERLSVHVHAPETVPDGELQGATTLLAGAGADLGKIRRVRFKVSENQIRFYHDSDAASALALADLIGARARDFTGYRPSPPDGTIEVYLAGDSVAPPPRSATTRQRPQKTEVERLRDRIVQQLRRGDHL